MDACTLQTELVSSANLPVCTAEHRLLESKASTSENEIQTLTQETGWGVSRALEAPARSPWTALPGVKSALLSQHHRILPDPRGIEQGSQTAAHLPLQEPETFPLGSSQLKKSPQPSQQGQGQGEKPGVCTLGFPPGSCPWTSWPPVLASGCSPLASRHLVEPVKVTD